MKDFVIHLTVILLSGPWELTLKNIVDKRGGVAIETAEADPPKGEAKEPPPPLFAVRVAQRLCRTPAATRSVPHLFISRHPCSRAIPI